MSLYNFTQNQVFREVHIEHNIDFCIVKTNKFSIFKGYTNLDLLKDKRQDRIDINNLTVLWFRCCSDIAFMSFPSTGVIHVTLYNWTYI